MGRVCVSTRSLPPYGELKLLWNRRHTPAADDQPGRARRRRHIPVSEVQEANRQAGTGTGKRPIYSI